MTSRAIERAIECGGYGGSVTMVFDIQELERFYALAQAQALMDAAEKLDEQIHDVTDSVEWLRRMAEELERSCS